MKYEYHNAGQFLRGSRCDASLEYIHSTPKRQ
jgi:hypothetical protein